MNGDNNPQPNPNNVHHIFGRPEHNLDVLVEDYGTQGAEYRAIEAALIRALPPGGTGVFPATTVVVGGHQVIVVGVYVDGVPRIGTAYIPS